MICWKFRHANSSNFAWEAKSRPREDASQVDFPRLCAPFCGRSTFRMAKHSQHQQGASTPGLEPGAGSQAVVELCEISSCGLVFWSRRRFEIGAEIQVRMHRSAVPLSCHHHGTGKWVNLRGWVVACPSLRRLDGAYGFQVSLLIEPSCAADKPRRARAKMCWSRPRVPGLRRFGLN